MSSRLSDLPAVHVLLADARLKDVPRAVARRAAREIVAEVRAELIAGGTLDSRLEERVVERVEQLRARRLRRVINATGVVLHTNLGRAPLAQSAVEAVADVARGYSNVELELKSGRRGGRLSGVSAPLRSLTGAEDAIAVNNGAAALLLALTTLARGRGVVVSRGELVEIGGSFRIPEVVSAGGANLLEVGTTNRTRAEDFARGLTDEAAVLLRVHPSNFRLVGFVERPDRAELVALSRRTGVPLIEDLGSGLLGQPPVADAGLEAEAVDAAIKAGVDLVVFSGDKLLGGPQAGLIVGRQDLVAACRKHPLYRALRLDKLGLAALEATLQLYVEGRAEEVPTRRMLGVSERELEQVARALAEQLPGARCAPSTSVSGGGALPEHGLATAVVELPLDDPDRVARALRMGDPAVVARVSQGCLVIDPRTLLPGEVEELLPRLRAVLAEFGLRR